MDAIKQSKRMMTVGIICGFAISGSAAFASNSAGSQLDILNQSSPLDISAPSKAVVAPQSEIVEPTTTMVNIGDAGQYRGKPKIGAKAHIPMLGKGGKKKEAPEVKTAQVPQTPKEAKKPKAPKEPKVAKLPKEKEQKEAKESKEAKVAKAKTEQTKEAKAQADKNGLLSGTKAASEKLVSGSKQLGDNIGEGTKKMGSGIASGAKASGTFFVKGAKAFGSGMQSAGEKMSGVPKMIKLPGKEKSPTQVAAKTDKKEKKEKKPKDAVSSKPTQASVANQDFDKSAQNKSKEALSAYELNQRAAEGNANNNNVVAEKAPEVKAPEAPKAQDKANKNGKGIVGKTLSIMPKMPKMPFMGSKKSPTENKSAEAQTASSQAVVPQ